MGLPKWKQMKDIYWRRCSLCPCPKRGIRSGQAPEGQGQSLGRHGGQALPVLDEEASRFNKCRASSTDFDLSDSFSCCSSVLPKHLINLSWYYRSRFVSPFPGAFHFRRCSELITALPPPYLPILILHQGPVETWPEGFYDQ